MPEDETCGNCTHWRAFDVGDVGNCDHPDQLPQDRHNNQTFGSETCASWEAKNEGPFTTESKDPMNQEICDAANNMVTGGDGPTPGEIMAWRFTKEGDDCPRCEGDGTDPQREAGPCALCKGARQKGRELFCDYCGQPEANCKCAEEVAKAGVTGRLKSSLPNLANQPPKGTELKPSDREEKPARVWPALRDMDRETLLAFREDQELDDINERGLDDEELREAIRFALEP